MRFVSFRASRPFTEHVAGRGMVVFNAEKKDGSGKVIRKATEAELPEAQAIDRADRGFGEITSKGVERPKVSPLQARREKRLAAREASRANRRQDGAVLNTGTETQGEAVLTSDLQREQREDAKQEQRDALEEERAARRAPADDEAPAPRRGRQPKPKAPVEGGEAETETDAPAE